MTEIGYISRQQADRLGEGIPRQTNYITKAGCEGGEHVCFMDLGWCHPKDNMSLLTFSVQLSD